MFGIDEKDDGTVELGGTRICVTMMESRGMEFGVMNFSAGSLPPNNTIVGCRSHLRSAFDSFYIASEAFSKPRRRFALVRDQNQPSL